MKYLVKIFYLDGKEVNVVLEGSRVETFLKSAKENEPYWEENKEAAFWTPENQVRYITINKTEEEEIKQQEEIQEIVETEEPKNKDE